LEKTYLITGVEPMLYKNFKAACAHYELTINEVFIKHIEHIVEDYLRAKSEFKDGNIYKLRKGKTK